MKFGKQQALALFYILLGLTVAFFTSQIKYRFAVASEDVGPRFFPYCCAAGFVVCGACKLISSLRKQGSGKKFIPDLSGWGRMILILGVLYVYVLGLKYAGYIVSGILMLTVLTAMLGFEQRPPLWKSFLFSTAVTLSTYFFFEKAVHVLLPAGTWIKPILRMVR